MITPIQRVMRYQMLLNDYRKHLEKKGILEDIDYLRQACNMIKVHTYIHTYSLLQIIFVINIAI